jgi:hypothetical protein
MVHVHSENDTTSFEIFLESAGAEYPDFELRDFFVCFSKVYVMFAVWTIIKIVQHTLVTQHLKAQLRILHSKVFNGHNRPIQTFSGYAVNPANPLVVWQAYIITR